MRAVLFCFLVFAINTTYAQRYNYVIQTADYSFGAFISGGVNIHTQSNNPSNSALGYQNSFGFSYLRHFKPFSLDIGASYGDQWLHYKSSEETDSFKGNYGLRFKYIGIPIGINYRLSPNKNRTILLAGIEPTIALNPTLYEFESSNRNAEANSYFPPSTRKKPLNFQIYAGLGKSFDLSPQFMIRAELKYQYNQISAFEERYTGHSIIFRLLFAAHQ